VVEVTPAAVPAGAPMAAAAAKGPVVPAAGLVSAVEKVRPIGGWGCATVVATAAVLVGAPVATVALVGRSREVAAAWTVVRAVSKSVGATSEAAEATTMISRSVEERLP
jgi:hypothetical protein